MKGIVFQQLYYTKTTCTCTFTCTPIHVAVKTFFSFIFYQQTYVPALSCRQLKPIVSCAYKVSLLQSLVQPTLSVMPIILSTIPTYIVHPCMAVLRVVLADVYVFRVFLWNSSLACARGHIAIISSKSDFNRCMQRLPSYQSNQVHVNTQVNLAVYVMLLEKKAKLPDHGAYGLPIKTNRFFIEC